MDKLSTSVPLPSKIIDDDQTPGYVRGLHDSLTDHLRRVSRRANGLLPKDGSEEMDGNLLFLTTNIYDIGEAAGRRPRAMYLGQDPTSDPQAATKKYVDDKVATAVFASGTRIPFDQDSAPTGWTRDTTINDRVIRIVSGTRVDGGSWTVGGLTVASHTHGAGTYVAASHAHNVSRDGWGGQTQTTSGRLCTAFGAVENEAANDISTGAAAPAVSGASGSASPAVNSDASWRPLHRDMIIASKN